ncbi:hypothetical protein ACFVZX_42315, partial [Streptomyces erythrochromogenes]
MPRATGPLAEALAQRTVVLDGGLSNQLAAQGCDLTGGLGGGGRGRRGGGPGGGAPPPGRPAAPPRREHPPPPQRGHAPDP